MTSEIKAGTEKAGEKQKISSEKREIILAGGCFWCLQPPFDKMKGVLKTHVGYAGGPDSPRPTYETVSAGGTGHLEVIKITYDPDLVTYEELLHIFWHNIDPLDGSGQFCDKGPQYRSAIFYKTPEEKAAAEKSLQDISGLLSGSVKTEILPLKTFFEGEDYHQDYYKKNPLRYKFYRFNCGRDKRLEVLWGKKVNSCQAKSVTL